MIKSILVGLFLSISTVAMAQPLAINPKLEDLTKEMLTERPTGWTSQRRWREPLYFIDLRTKICFAYFGPNQDYTTVPCTQEVIKELIKPFR